MRASIIKNGMKRLCLSKDAEAGMVSIIVTLILIFIITIIVMGFSVIIQHNERQAVDRNLSSRAFYAAESGVNMAINHLKDYKNGKTNCNQYDSILKQADYTIDASSSTQITCLTIDDTPTTLTYDSITKETSQVIPFNSASGNINSIDINWENTTGVWSYNPSSCNGRFPADGSWNCPPLLRIDLVPSGGALLNRDGLLNSVFTIFAYPTPENGIATINYPSPVTQGSIVNAKCSATNAPRQCRIRIGNLGGVAYTARVMSFYSNAKLTVCANGTGSCDIHLKGVQAVIDSTARAMDVVRRIQVRYKLDSNIIPGFTAQTAAGLCKRYGIIPSTGTADIVGTAGGEIASTSLNTALASNLCSL